MKDDGLESRLRSTGSPTFNWIKTAPLGLDQRGHWLFLCLNDISVPSLAYGQSDKDRAMSVPSPGLQNRFGTQALSDRVVLFLLESRALMQQGKTLPIGTATDLITDCPTLVTMEICSICPVT